MKAPVQVFKKLLKVIDFGLLNTWIALWKFFFSKTYVLDFQFDLVQGKCNRDQTWNFIWNTWK